MKLVVYSKEFDSITISPELYGFEVFAVLNKKRKDKKLLLVELLYIYHFYNIMSDFVIVHEDIRGEEIKSEIGLPANWKMDKPLEDFAEFYKNHSKTVASELLETAYGLTMKVKDYVDNIDLNAKDKSGKPINTLAEAMSAGKQIPEMFNNIAKAEESYRKSNVNEGRIRGGGELKGFENGFEDMNPDEEEEEEEEDDNFSLV